MKKQLKEWSVVGIVLFRKRLVYLAVLLSLMLLFFFFKGSGAAMNFMSDNVAYPVRIHIAAACSATGWSVAEWVVIAAALFIFLFFFFFAASLIRQRKKIPLVLFRYLTSGASVVLTIAVLMNLLWNVNYYADGFQQKSGVIAREISIGELYDTTMLFAGFLAESSSKVARDENGLYSEDLDAVFELSKTVFRGIEAEFPFLEGKELQSKKVRFSRALSEIRTTGVAFPFTGEANINIDQPAAWIPATIAHEIAHQRRIASEQEANFVAILACDLSGSEAYRYSGCLLAYNHLARALSKEDHDGFREIAQSLPDEVRADLKFHYNYWQRFDTRISDISDSLYDDYLKNQGQELGTKSYGAVVDLLVVYYTG